MSKFFDPAQFDEAAQQAAKDLFEEFARTEEDARGALDEAPPFVFAKITQKGVTDESGQPLVMPGAIVFFTSTSPAGEYEYIAPRGTMDSHPYEPFVGIFAGGSKGRINWGPGTPQKGKEPRCKSPDGVVGIPAEDFVNQIPSDRQCAGCPYARSGCDETRVFAVVLKLTEDEAETFGMPFYPVILQFTKSAISRIADFNMWVTGRGKACLGPMLGVPHAMYWHDIIVKLGCEYTQRKGGYYMPTFAYSGLVNPEIVPQVRALRASSMDRMLPAASDQAVIDAAAADYEPTHSGPPRR